MWAALAEEVYPVLEGEGILLQPQLAVESTTVRVEPVGRRDPGRTDTTLHQPCTCTHRIQ